MEILLFLFWLDVNEVWCTNAEQPSIIRASGSFKLHVIGLQVVQYTPLNFDAYTIYWTNHIYIHLVKRIYTFVEVQSRMCNIDAFWKDKNNEKVSSNSKTDEFDAGLGPILLT